MVGWVGSIDARRVGEVWQTLTCLEEFRPRQASVWLCLSVPELRCTRSQCYHSLASFPNTHLTSRNPHATMSFDPGNFTLHFIRRAAAPAVIDLRLPVAPHATSAALAAAAAAPPLYTFERARTSNAQYDVELRDGLSETPLATMQCATSAERSRTLRLLNPDQAVGVEKEKNTFSQAWSFAWEG